MHCRSDRSAANLSQRNKNNRQSQLPGLSLRWRAFNNVGEYTPRAAPRVISKPRMSAAALRGRESWAPRSADPHWRDDPLGTRRRRSRPKTDNKHTVVRFRSARVNHERSGEKSFLIISLFERMVGGGGPSKGRCLVPRRRIPTRVFPREQRSPHLWDLPDENAGHKFSPLREECYEP